jgi:hypothetical protein
MIEWLKNTFGKSAQKVTRVNYVVAEFHVDKKKPRKEVDPLVSELEEALSASSEYMQIDQLHQKN